MSTVSLVNERRSIREQIAIYALPIALVALIVFFSLSSSAFLTVRNIVNIFRQVSIVGICAMGMTFVILTGGIDLSVGSVLGVSVVTCASLMVAGLSPILAILISLVAGVVIGFLVGVFVNEVGIPPLITTLGFMTALRGVAFRITNGLPVYDFPDSFAVIGQGYVGVIPVPVIIMMVVVVVCVVVLNRTKFGRHVYGLGGNEEATRLSGVDVKRTKYTIYMLEGLLAALAGVVLLSRVNSGQPAAGQGYEMDIITGVVLGGVSISGGSGRIGGVVVGVLLMGVLTNGMILMNVDEYSQWMVKGLVLVAAVSLDTIASRRGATA